MKYTKSRKVIFILVLVIILSLLLIYVNKERELEVSYFFASYDFDQNNLYEVVGYSDHVFVAKVEKNIKTKYDHVERIKLWKKFGLPYTQYSLRVIENIKGHIEKNTEILYQQFGGLSIDKKVISLVQGDQLLEEGAYYIIAASTRSDGALYSTAPKGHQKIEITSEDKVLNLQAVKDFCVYYEDETFNERPRYNYNE